MLRAVAVLIAALMALTAGACSRADAGPSPAPEADLTVRRGSFEERYLLTGELRAAEAVYLTVPRSPTWQIQIRWIEEDGAEVRRGQKVLELDNTSFAADLEDRKLALAESESSLARTRAEAAAAVAEREFTVEQKRAELEKARLEAAVPAELLPAREQQDRQLALRRAEMELDKARSELESVRGARELEIEMQEIDLAKSRREIEVAEEAIRSLSLEAPTDGVLVVQENPREGRKLQVGDTVWVGLPVIQIPDLETLEVRAILSDVDEGRIRPGQRALVTPDAFPDRRLPGRVLEIAPVAREVEWRSLRRSFEVRIALDQVDAERMRPGMSVKAEVLGSPLDDILLAPRAGLDLGGEGPRAFLATGGARPVTLGPCNPTHCVVEEGLREGERLVRPPAAASPGGAA